MKEGSTHSLHHSKSDLSAGRSVFPFIPASTTETLFFGNRNSLLCPTMEVSGIGGLPRPDGPLCRLSSPSYSPATQRILTVARDGGSLWYGQFCDAASDMGRNITVGVRSCNRLQTEEWVLFYCEKCVKWEWICVICKHIWNFVKYTACCLGKRAKKRLTPKEGPYHWTPLPKH